MSTRPHPSGDRHWTRREPERVLRGPAAPGAKLSAATIERMIQESKGGASQTWLARKYNVARITVWRHVRKSET